MRCCWPMPYISLLFGIGLYIKEQQIQYLQMTASISLRRPLFFCLPSWCRRLVQFFFFFFLILFYFFFNPARYSWLAAVLHKSTGSDTFTMLSSFTEPSTRPALVQKKWEKMGKENRRDDDITAGVAGLPPVIETTQSSASTGCDIWFHHRQDSSFFSPLSAWLLFQLGIIGWFETPPVLVQFQILCCRLITSSKLSIYTQHRQTQPRVFNGNSVCKSNGTSVETAQGAIQFILTVEQPPAS